LSYRPVLDQAELERALQAAGIVAPAHWSEVTGSTNATAMELASSGAPEWTLVATGHQTAGRGRLGRTWEDRPGRALMFSLVLRPALDPVDVGLLSLLAGAAMAEAGAEASGLAIRCAWPNDLMRAGGKVGGILSEALVGSRVIHHVVMGVGVNLDPPSELIPGSAGLGPKVDPRDLLIRFLLRFRDGYRPGVRGFAAATVRRWSAVSGTLGHEVVAAREPGATVRGRASGVDEHGGLLVDTGSGIVAVSFGEVVHLDRRG
jgi:BirA family biotin operon repressor/biotin-[acetyl-CoA-carboxylase] ligase